MTVFSKVCQSLRPTLWKVIFSLLSAGLPWVSINYVLMQQCFAIKMRCSSCPEGPFPGFLLYTCCCRFGTTTAFGFFVQLAILILPAATIYILWSMAQSRRAKAPP